MEGQAMTILPCSAKQPCCILLSGLLGMPQGSCSKACPCSFKARSAIHLSSLISWETTATGEQLAEACTPECNNCQYLYLWTQSTANE